MELADVIKRMSESLSVGRSFGTPYERDGTMVIPVAYVAGGGGGGEGTSTPTEWDDDGESPGGTSPSSHSGRVASNGSGGGFGGVVVPLGVYVVRDDDVEWVPAINSTVVIIVAFGVVRLLIKMFGRHHR